MASLETNIIYCGDNLEVLPQYIPDESVDLVYIDPPFNSSRNYEVFWGEAQERRAFEDRFGDAMTYLDWMRPRIREIYRILKPTGSFYYHCDWHASHYVKIELDRIFGFENFRNEIVWSYRRYTGISTAFQRMHDVLLFYGKNERTTFNVIRDSYGTKSGKADSHYRVDDEGHWYRWQKRKGHAPYKVYLAEGRRLGDVWEIPHINASAKERLGYPTQGQDFGLRDMPKTAAQLRRMPHFEFENWAVVALGGIPNKGQSGRLRHRRTTLPGGHC